MLAENELIFLDAVLVEVIALRAFRADLSNGHRLVVWLKPNRASEVLPWRVGDRVRVRLSPFDLSVGELVGKA